MRFFLLAVGLGLVAVACGSTSTSGPGDSSDGGSGDSDGGPGSNGGDGGTSNADSGSFVGGGSGTADPTDLGKGMPQVVLVTKTGGVLATPKVVAMTYDNDTNRAELESFLTAFSKSVAWSAPTMEYGVGALSVSTPIHLTGNAPKTMKDTDAHAILKAHAPLDPSTIYTLFLPAGTVIDDGSGSKCCTDYDGYHSDYSTGGVTAVYSIVCACPGFDGKATTDLQQLTVAAAHETIEAATDPHSKNEGYSQPDDAHIAWSLVTGGETGDMCAFADTAYWIPKDMKYMAQRSWSNAAAAAGHDPCVGEASSVYYNTIPQLTDSVTLADYGITTKSIKIPLGSTATLKLKIYADTAGAGPFTVSVDDYSGMGYIAVKNPAGTFNSGDTVSVDITAKSADPNYTGAEIFVVSTAPANGKGPTTYYWGLVSQ